jgi:carboxyl-terminal processing protease
LDGAGIEPDDLVADVSYAPISYTLVTGNHIFDFATQYFYSHESISNPRSFEISDQDYEDFKRFLEGKEYDYTTYIEKSVQDLEKYAEKEIYFEEIKSQLDAIKAKVNHSKEQDLDNHKDEVKKILSEEIVSRYYFQEGMIQSGLDQDPGVELAKTYLADPAKIAKTLSASVK